MTRTRLNAPGIAIALIIATTIGILAALHLRSNSAVPSFGARAATVDPASQPLGSFNPATIYAKDAPGTVTIQSVVGDETIEGSGFVADSSGHIITASHVVFDYQRGMQAGSVYVDLASNDRVVAQVVGLDQFSDIAVLKIDPAGVHLHPLTLGDSDSLIPGQSVAAIGAPFGFAGSMSTGIISATNRTIPSLINRDSTIAAAIQTDTAINHGNSGGPLFDANGDVIGINQQIKTANGSATTTSESADSSGVAFAVPSRTIARSFHQILATGHVSYAHLGIVTTTVTPQLAAHGSLAAPHGVVVSNASGPATLAGISAAGPAIDFDGDTVQLGDEIVSIDGQAILTSDDVTRIASTLTVGQGVTVVFFHGNTRRTATLTPTAKAL